MPRPRPEELLDRVPRTAPWGRFGHTAAAVVITLTVVLDAAPGHAILYDRCESAVASRIAELGIDPADVAGVRTFPELTGGRTSTVARGVKAWVSLKTCEGSVVIVTTKSCRVKQTYTRGACTVPGLEE